MKQVLFKQGKVVVEEVPSPKINDNSVLVENYYSLISSGTDLTSLSFSKAPLPLKVLRYPTKLSKGLRLVKEHGLFQAYKIAKGFLESGVAPGYSSCGKVIKVGKNIKDIKEGEIVACAGAGFASHAEYVVVPRNLVAKVPEEVSFKEATSTTLGAIALNGVRQADLKIGESAVILGLGLIGQLTAQILLANGIKVIGIEPSKQRQEMAKKLGVKYVLEIKKNLKEEVLGLTNFYGADATIITASNPQDNSIINLALELTRKKGKVIVLGDIGLKIERLNWYEKEIDLRIVSSYGPGRGDEEYEKKGIDYPYAYVRWTENRNMQAYLELLKERKIDFLSLIGGEYHIKEADLAYKLLASNKKPLAVLISYFATPKEEKKPNTSIEVAPPKKIEGKIKVGVVGVGAFFQTVHLPNLLRLRNFYHLKTICTHNAVQAKYFAKRTGANLATTNYEDVLEDKEIDLVIITTRHNAHAKMVIEALEHNKNVFVEKPLCLTFEELEEINKIIKRAKTTLGPVLTVGFNRRFSPFISKIKEIVQERRNPLMINYLVNDLYLPPSHWTNTSEGGGRILGNACHMFNLFLYLINSEVTDVSAFSIKPSDSFYLKTDNFSASLRFKDGSLANLFYTTEGSEKAPKEKITVYCEGIILELINFKNLIGYGIKAKMSSFKIQKGHFEELKELAKSLYQRKWLIPWEEIYETTKVSLEVDKQVREKG
ncbi:MAG: bi-domain-containing oxidoreductase [Minisyncoccia bacterium]